MDAVLEHPDTVRLRWLMTHNLTIIFNPGKESPYQLWLAKSPFTKYEGKEIDKTIDVAIADDPVTTSKPAAAPTTPTSTTTLPAWEHLRTDETRQIEEVLRAKFTQVDAYRYNSASIRLRVVDTLFAGLSNATRDDVLARHLRTLSEDIVFILAMTPSDDDHVRQAANDSFENPEPSKL
jgi:hypothetical protein